MHSWGFQLPSVCWREGGTICQQWILQIAEKWERRQTLHWMLWIKASTQCRRICFVHVLFQKLTTTLTFTCRLTLIYYIQPIFMTYYLSCIYIMMHWSPWYICTPQCRNINIIIEYLWNKKSLTYCLSDMTVVLPENVEWPKLAESFEQIKIEILAMHYSYDLHGTIFIIYTLIKQLCRNCWTDRQSSRTCSTKIDQT